MVSARVGVGKGRSRNIAAPVTALCSTVLFPLVLTGCMSAGYQAVFTFTEVVSYATSGKTATDHTLSFIAEEDCRKLRAIQERPVCIAGPDDRIRLSGNGTEQAVSSHAIRTEGPPAGSGSRTIP